MFAVFTLQFVLIPVDASLLMNRQQTVDLVRFILDMLQLTDMLKLFFTGFYHRGKSKVTLNFNTVAK